MLNTTVSLDDKYALTATRAYMSGIEALVRLPMLQRQRDLERGHNVTLLIVVLLVPSDLPPNTIPSVLSLLSNLG